MAGSRRALARVQALQHLRNLPGRHVASRAHHIAFCECQLGNHAAAAQLLWDTFTGDGLGWSEHLALDLHRLYTQAGQLDDLQHRAVRRESPT